MTNEVLDRAAGFATCQILQAAGSALVGVGAYSLAAGGAGVVPLTLGSLSLLGAGFACQPINVDGTDPLSQIDGCQKISIGGYGQIQYKDGSDWKIFGSSALNTDKATEIEEIKVVPNGTQGFQPQVTYTYLNGSQPATAGVSSYPTEGEAGAVVFRIAPTVGECVYDDKNPPNPPPEAFTPVPYTDEETGCTYNVQLLGFVEQLPGMTQDPVYLITGSDALRASGGIVGGCNFSPTVYYGGSGGGGGFGGDDGASPFPYVPGDDDDGTPKWLDTLIAALGGAATALATDALLDAIQAAFATKYPGLIYRMVSVCEKNDQGKPISEAVEVPIPDLKAPDAQLARLDAIVELLQASKNFKQPVCEDETPEPKGDFRTIQFRSDSPSPFSNSRLRKRFRYRSVSGLGLGEVVDYWKDFTFESGPVVVGHLGSSWGSPQVWAASEDEGKRVIRHAAGEAGIDPDQVGRWRIGSSNSSRYGVSDTMRIDTEGGFYRITSRDGSDGRPIVAKDIDL